MYRFVNGMLSGVVITMIVSFIWAKCGGKTAIFDTLNGTILLQNNGNKYMQSTFCEWLIQGK